MGICEHACIHVYQRVNNWYSSSLAEGNWHFSSASQTFWSISLRTKLSHRIGWKKVLKKNKTKNQIDLFNLSSLAKVFFIPKSNTFYFLIQSVRRLDRGSYLNMVFVSHRLSFVRIDLKQRQSPCIFPKLVYILIQINPSSLFWVSK